MTDASPINFDPAPRASDPASLGREIVDRLAYQVGKDPIVAKSHDWLEAAILVVRDRAIERWMASTRTTYQAGDKRVYYLSLEFLIGRLMRDAVSNLGLTDSLREALKSLGVDYDEIAELESDAALGNGGLGRLAACFMESMASIGVPAYGYGIRYRHGLFRQKIVDGWQAELPRPGSSTATPGSSTAAKAPTRSASADSSNTRRASPAPIRPMSGSRPNGSSPRPTTRRSSAGGASG